MRTQHALKIERMPPKAASMADQIVAELREFAESIDYSFDRISDLECRSRDGFIPHSHNYGGIECVAFRNQYSCCENTGFENTDETLRKGWECDLENFLADRPEYPKSYSDLTDAQCEELDEYRRESDDTVLFSLDIMHTGFERGIHSINLRFCICAKDSPYHRKYDDLFEFDITFRTIESLKRQLAKIMRDRNVQKFSSNLREAF